MENLAPITVKNFKFMHKLIELRKFMKGMYYQMLDFAESECSYNLNQENVNKIADTFKKRNESLAKKIDLHCQPGRTVFVIAGTSHILKSNSLFEFLNLAKEWIFYIMS